MCRDAVGELTTPNAAPEQKKIADSLALMGLNMEMLGGTVKVGNYH